MQLPYCQSLSLHIRANKSVIYTCKTLSDSLVANEAAVSVVHVTFSESLIDCAQVQVDSIVQVKLCHIQICLWRRQQ